MIITFREVLSAIRRFGFQPNESVLIFGAGPVGLCFTKFCKLLGLKTVITTDVMDDKVEGAKKAGADYAFNSAKCDINAEVKRLFPEGIDYVVDAVGINSLINQAMGLIRYNGKICCYGISPKLMAATLFSRCFQQWNRAIASEEKETAALISQKPPCTNRRMEIPLLDDGFFSFAVVWQI